MRDTRGQGTLDELAQKLAKEEAALGGKKRKAGQYTDEEPVSEKDDDLFPGVGTRRGQGSSKRAKLSSQATVRPPE